MNRDLILMEARRLYKLGFAIIWLEPGKKKPIGNGWTTGPRKSWETLLETYQPGMNMGVRLGEASQLSGGYLACIDVDIKSPDSRFKEEAFNATKEIVGDTELPVVHSGRGMGSRHLYCITEKPFQTFNPAQSREEVRYHSPSKKVSKRELRELGPDEIKKGTRIGPAWQVSLYSTGRQMVLPPSIHPDTGKPYRWRKSGTLDFHVMDFSKIGVSQSAEKSHEAIPVDFEFEPVDVELAWLPISDEVKAAITDGTGVTDRSAYLLRASAALLSAGLDQNEVLSVLTDPDTVLGECAYEHAQTKNRAHAAAWLYRYTVKRVTEERSAETVFTGSYKRPRKLSPEEIEVQTESLLEDRNWRQDVATGKKGRTLHSLKNLDLIFANSVDGNPFVKDLFANRISYGVDTPWGGEEGKYLEDIDLILVKRWLADTEFQFEPNTQAILEATNLVAHRHRFHPVRDWLESLVWDKKSRIDTWIKDYCRAIAPEPYLTEISRKFLLAMVKRVFEPGCQWDLIPVLQGKQGKLKSSVARALASERWFMDHLPDLRDKDAMLNLQGSWLVELAELANTKRSDDNLVKGYLSRRVDKVRPPYGRVVSEVPRQSVFIGTVNEGQFLKDPTGNRRYCPIAVGLCDAEGVKRDRDQLFAEAYHRYRNEPEILKLGEEADAQALILQDEGRVDDDSTAMQEALRDFARSKEGKSFSFDRFRAKDLFHGPGAPWGRWADKNYAYQTASQVLQNVGFKRTKTEGQRVWRGDPSLIE